ncbi:helix-turn-helix domain-containing protein [Salibacterium salarium]|uniref:Helix-turn-helix domain-containing protein n=1 Tax=Salibacterium salarium TaxID=284579 RepID=A0A428NAA2_9BACI|nr:helix-turn-helix domain-containing protein [Salibacterium salarium]RSL35313.1 helix-turn-helix domain-containing protein [Salibacterium salarium]
MEDMEEVAENLTEKQQDDKSGMYMRVHFSFINGPLSEMKPNTLATTLALGRFIDKNGECFPTYKQLGEVLGISRDAVKKRIEEVKKYRYNGESIVEVINRNVEGGRNTSNLYRLNRKYISIFSDG